MSENNDEKIRLSEMKFKLSAYLVWTGRGFIFGPRDISIPEKYKENEIQIPKEHITVNLKKLLEEEDIKSLSLEDMSTLISFHRTENECRNDDRTRYERGSDDVLLRDILNEFKETIPPQLIHNKDNIDNMNFNELIPMINCWDEVLTKGDRPFIKKEESDEEEQYIPNISIKEYKEKVDIDFKDLFSFDVEIVKPGKKWNIEISFDFGKCLRYTWEVLQICDIPEIKELTWEDFQTAIDNEGINEVRK